MDWLDRMNEALDYIESHLDRKMETETLAKFACCSSYHFQRMFSYIAGVTLSEYIRRRKMSLAAVDLAAGDKVLEVALRYGYESPTSFNRAFQSVHGITPSAAQKEGNSVKAFPRISFKITVKGESEMEYRILKKEGFRIVGVKAPLCKEIEKNFEIVPGMWGKAAADGTVEKLVTMMGADMPGILGVSACNGEEDWSYYIAVATEKEAMEGMEEYKVPAATWAVFPGEGLEKLQELEKRIVTEWLPSSGYEYADGPDLEVYLEMDPAKAKYEVWIPVVKK